MDLRKCQAATLIPPGANASTSGHTRSPSHGLFISCFLYSEVRFGRGVSLTMVMNACQLFGSVPVEQHDEIIKGTEQVTSACHRGMYATGKSRHFLSLVLMRKKETNNKAQNKGTKARRVTVTNVDGHVYIYGEKRMIP